jgi:hypothetical protein
MFIIHFVWAANISSTIFRIWGSVHTAAVSGSSITAWYSASLLPVRAASTVSSWTLTFVRFRAASCDVRKETAPKWTACAFPKSCPFRASRFFGLLTQGKPWYVFSEVFDLKPTSGLSTRKTG